METASGTVERYGAEEPITVPYIGSEDEQSQHVNKQLRKGEARLAVDDFPTLTASIPPDHNPGYEAPSLLVSSTNSFDTIDSNPVLLYTLRRTWRTGDPATQLAYSRSSPYSSIWSESKDADHDISLYRFVEHPY